MPFIPHTEEEVQKMLAQIGCPDIESLFAEIPEELRIDTLDVPEGLDELSMKQLLQQRFSQDAKTVNFAGAGAYEHHIPDAVWDLVSRGEFLTAYTPYQAEASQGTLQILFEYQTMMASLMGHEVSNASLYDGATALAEAALMAVRSSRKSKSVILVPDSLHPTYREVLHSIVTSQGIELKSVPFAVSAGHTTIESLEQAYEQVGEICALIIPQPNYFGVMEEVSMLTDWAHSKGALVIACVNPVAMACLIPPGQWGEQGADIACGEGQPLGVPLNRGGPYFGFMTCKKKLIRQIPGRLVGQTIDKDGKRGFTLTLQAREQHIRRSKATSNICTNQGLLVTAATIHMSLMGADGLKQAALASHQNTVYLAEQLQALPGIKLVFNRPFFHEVAVHCPISASETIEHMIGHGFFAGIDLGKQFPELDEALLICATEVRTKAEIDMFVTQLKACWGISS